MTIESFMPSFRMLAAEYAYRKGGVTKESRHRLSKEIAQELRSQHGVGAYLYCVEKLSTETQNPQLWRDVLSWLDEIETETKERTNEGS